MLFYKECQKSGRLHEEMLGEGGGGRKAQLVDLAQGRTPDNEGNEGGEKKGAAKEGRTRRVSPDGRPVEGRKVPRQKTGVLGGKNGNRRK